MHDFRQPRDLYQPRDSRWILFWLVVLSPRDLKEVGTTPTTHITSSATPVGCDTQNYGTFKEKLLLRLYDSNTMLAAFGEKPSCKYEFFSLWLQPQENSLGCVLGVSWVYKTWTTRVCCSFTHFFFLLHVVDKRKLLSVMFGEFDIDKNGRLDQTELVARQNQYDTLSDFCALDEFLRNEDLNLDGFLSLPELLTAYGKILSLQTNHTTANQPCYSPVCYRKPW